ncbi:hypothetical protein N7478_008074 [Penicillium angulare]|uniref:uncharacterized protein n=1 Tax=Penicillium angulare TaxID=116970 RepID=UPI002540125D|nr:uncharacterized protein N7478_008074 [Penicillium angulare]KAJ5272949.1 hypothetical protein N7478_008074 [Penicillium angulare]
MIPDIDFASPKKVYFQNNKKEHFAKVLATLDLPPGPRYRFDLTQLDDPPDDWVFLEKPFDKVEGRNHKFSALQTMAHLQLWGIHWTEEKSPTKLLIMRAVWKYHYYVPKKFHPKFFADLYNLQRDSGPRLIKWDYHEEDVGPISRLHPVRPDPYRPVCPGYLRPNDAAWHVADIDIERYLLPIMVVVPTLPQIRHAFSMEGPMPKVPVPESPQKKKRDIMIRPVTPDPNAARAFTPRGISPVIEAPQFPFNYQPLTESLERAIVHFTYRHLERSPDAPAKADKPPYGTANSEADLKQVQLHAYPAYSHLRLNPSTLEFDRKSTCLYPYRGRGPIWSNKSCAIDCVIMLGSLLQAGCTRIDRESPRFLDLTDLEHAFIEVTNTNWDALEPQQNIQIRDMFRQKLCNIYPSIKMTESCPVWAVWAESTRNMAQFYFRFTDIYNACPCTNMQVAEVNKYANCVLPAMQDSDRDGVWLQELIERTLYKKRLGDCPQCGARQDQWETRIHELPPRMIVSNYAGVRARIINHTSDVRFRYIDPTGEDKVATYRWLGGVYHQDDHVRLYWSDQERGNKERFEVAMFDDQVSGGAFFGGIQPTHETERVPPDWTTIGFLIGAYERVMNPPEVMLQSAVITVQNLESIVKAGYPVLDRHSPWDHRIAANTDDPSFRFMDSLVNEKRLIAAHIFDEVLEEGDDEDEDGDESDQEMLQGQTYENLANIWPPVDGNVMPEEYTNLFDGILDTPGSLSHLPELWPNGVPGDHGALNFPMLPRSEPSHTVPNSRHTSPAKPFDHWPSPNRPLKPNGWGRPFGWDDIPFGTEVTPMGPNRTPYGFGGARPDSFDRPGRRSSEIYQESPKSRYYPYSPRRTPSVLSKSPDNNRVIKSPTSPNVKERRAESQEIMKKKDKKEGAETRRKRALPRKEKEEAKRRKKTNEEMDTVKQVEEEIKDKKRKTRSELKGHMADEHAKRQKKKTKDSKKKKEKAKADDDSMKTWRGSLVPAVSSTSNFPSPPSSVSRGTPEVTSYRGSRGGNPSPRTTTSPSPRIHSARSNDRNTRSNDSAEDSTDKTKKSNDKQDNGQIPKKSSGEKKSTSKEKEKKKIKKTTTNPSPLRVSKSKSAKDKGIYFISTHISTLSQTHY